MSRTHSVGTAEPRPRALARRVAGFAALAGALVLPAAASAAAPATPANVKLTAVGAAQAVISWDAVAPGTFTRYAVYRNGASTPAFYTNPGITKYIDKRPAANNYAYQVAAVNGTDVSPKSPLITTGIVPTTAITGCSSTALGAGHYRLDADLTASGTTPCITLGDQAAAIANTTLDCQGHTINVTTASPYALYINKVNGYLLENCNITGPSGKTGTALRVNSSPDGAIDGSNFTSAGTTSIAVSSDRTYVVATKFNDTATSYVANTALMFKSDTLTGGRTSLINNPNTVYDVGNSFTGSQLNVSNGTGGQFTGNTTFTDTPVAISSSPTLKFTSGTFLRSPVTATGADGFALTGAGFTDSEVKVASAANANVSSNTFTRSNLTVSKSTSSTIGANTSTDCSISVWASAGSWILSNQMTADPARNIVLQLVIGRYQYLDDPNYEPHVDGSDDNYTVRFNTITGGWRPAVDASGNPIYEHDGVTQGKQGIDDNILLLGPIGHANVSDNTTNGSYDTGIETGNLITDSTFNNNTISHVDIAGIGAYWKTGWERNTVSNNTVTDAPAVAHVDSEDEPDSDINLDSIGGYPSGLTTFAIVDNTFTGNKLVNARSGTDPALYISGSPYQPSVRPTTVVHGNVIDHNDFGYYAQTPLFVPRPGTAASAMVVTASSIANKCNPQPTPALITCTPGGAPIVTAGPAPVRNSSGSYTLRATIDDNGSDSTTYIEFGKTTAYGTQTGTTHVSPGPPVTVAIITGVLSAHTTYHYRAVSTNGVGKTYGADQTFVTQ